MTDPAPVPAADDAPSLALTADVAEAGGWKDVTTLLTCYQRATNDALLAVMTEQRKMRDVAVVRRAEGET